MELELPNRLYGEGLEPQIMVIQKNDLKFSARLVHSFLCKELMTSKRHEKWFTFARRPLCKSITLRFGLQEYHAVTGLKVKRENNSGNLAKNVDGTADVSGRNKRKHVDRGAESRKKNVLCHLAASSKGNIDRG
uniref:DUF1985 domain-containing protein n=1 Tax=Brassica oleracea var. oleracea TaxID=109376 RepID=A0A0D3CQC1_BRAOL